MFLSLLSFILAGGWIDEGKYSNARVINADFFSDVVLGIDIYVTIMAEEKLLTLTIQHKCQSMTFYM